MVFTPKGLYPEAQCQYRRCATLATYANRGYAYAPRVALALTLGFVIQPLRGKDAAMSTVDQFAARAEAFRHWLIEGTDTRATAARHALIHLAELFAAALTLPDANPLGDITTTVADDEWKLAFQAARRLPVQWYGEVFDPRPVPPGEPGIGDTADDLADIYRDVVASLRAYQRGEPGAVWHWRFLFWAHWGQHAVGAMGALRAWLEADGAGC